MCSPWHHFHGGCFLGCPQSHYHTPEKNPLLQKGTIFPISWEHSSWITFASSLRSLKETLEAVGSSSAVLPSTSHGFLAETFVLDPFIFLVWFTQFKSKILFPKDCGYQSFVKKVLGELQVMASEASKWCHTGAAKLRCPALVQWDTKGHHRHGSTWGIKDLPWLFNLKGNGLISRDSVPSASRMGLFLSPRIL